MITRLLTFMILINITTRAMAHILRFPKLSTKLRGQWMICQYNEKIRVKCKKRNDELYVKFFSFKKGGGPQEHVYYYTKLENKYLASYMVLKHLLQKTYLEGLVDKIKLIINEAPPQLFMTQLYSIKNPTHTLNAERSEYNGPFTISKYDSLPVKDTLPYFYKKYLKQNVISLDIEKIRFKDNRYSKENILNLSLMCLLFDNELLSNLRIIRKKKKILYYPYVDIKNFLSNKSLTDEKAKSCINMIDKKEITHWWRIFLKKISYPGKTEFLLKEIPESQRALFQKNISNRFNRINKFLEGK